MRKLAFLATVLLACSATAGQKGLRLHMLSGAREYKAEECLKKLKTHLETHYGATCTLSLGKDKAKELPGLEAMKDADVLVVYCRRLMLGGDQLAAIQQWCADGKPVVGIRTASHAFQTWLAFDKEVLGGDYRGHGGMEQDVRVLIAEGAKDHPILAGIEPWSRACKMYHNPNPAKDITVLLYRKGGKGRGPLAWCRTHGQAKDGRAFYTPMGLPPDFENANFLRLLANAIHWVAKRNVPAK